jgi:hypothetical protein
LSIAVGDRSAQYSPAGLEVTSPIFQDLPRLPTPLGTSIGAMRVMMRRRRRRNRRRRRRRRMMMMHSMMMMSYDSCRLT